jgi:AraC family transcriptional regulator
MKQRLVRPPSEVSGFHSLENELRTFSGARIVQIFDAANTSTDEHAHDWPILSLHVVGTCRKIVEDAETSITGPSAVLHGVGAPHANVVGGSGLEQLEIQFDPAWIGMTRRQLRAMRWWTCGRVAFVSTLLAKIWRDPSADESAIAGATRRFLELALPRGDGSRPNWLEQVNACLEDEPEVPTREIALRLGVHPLWLTRTYRAVVGEGMHETRRRRRVERALALLAEGDGLAAEVAADAGFYDQSHMIRCFRAVLHRTPGEAQRKQFAMREP